MYNNIGEKIKTLVSFITKLGIAVSVFFGIMCMFLGARYAAAGIMLIVVLPLFLWISSFLLYGFGEIIAQLTEANRNTQKIYDLLVSRYDEGSDDYDDADASDMSQNNKEPQRYYVSSRK